MNNPETNDFSIFDKFFFVILLSTILDENVDVH